MRSIPNWYEGNASEPSVNLFLRDMIRPGSVVFDVGAFEGSLTSVMSRLVGPRGTVASFEANPAMLPILTGNMVETGATNVFLVHRAIHDRSGEFLQVHSPDGQPAATSVGVGDQRTGVESLALDDFVEATGLTPDVCKLDIEGAEHRAFEGFARTISFAKPHVVFEQNVGDDEALEWIRSRGYVTFCTNTYQKVLTSEDLSPGSTVRNIAAIHNSRLCGTPYGCISSFSDIGVFDQFRGDELHIVELPLAGGRYVLRLEAEISHSAPYVFCETVVNGKVVGKYYVDPLTFIANCMEIPVQIPVGALAEYRVLGIVGLPRLHVTKVEGIITAPATF